MLVLHVRILSFSVLDRPPPHTPFFSLSTDLSISVQSLSFMRGGMVRQYLRYEGDPGRFFSLHATVSRGQTTVFTETLPQDDERSVVHRRNPICKQERCALSERKN